MADTTTELEVLDQIVDVLGGQSGQYETVVPVLQQIKELLASGITDPEAIAEAVAAWLDEHPEATTTVQDGSITGVKIADNTIPDAKLVQTGGVLESVSQLRSELIAATATDSIIISVDENEAINVAGQIFINEGTDVCVAAVDSGKTLLVNTDNNVSIYAWFATYPHFNTVGIGSTRYTLTAGEHEIVVPDGAKYVAFRRSSGETLNIIYKDGLQDRVNNLESEIGTIPISGERITEGSIPTKALATATRYGYSNFINKSEMVANAYVNASGIVTPTSDFYATGIVELDEETTYYEKDLFIGYLAFYDASMNLVAGYNGSSSPFTLYNSAKSIYQFTTPQGTKFARFTAANSTRAGLCWVYSEPVEPIEYAYYLDAYSKAAFFEPKPTEYDGNEICIFRNCLCIGDSFTEGGFNADAHDADQGGEFQDYSYPTNLARMVGFNATNMGHGGLTTVVWNQTYTSTITTGYDVCVILLGINDCVYYGSFTSESQTALGSIIDKVEEENNGIKVFVCTIPKAPAYMTPAILGSAQTIRDYVEGLNDENVYLLDLAEYGHLNDSLAYTYGHPTAYGYHVLADDIRRYISYIISRNKTDFKFIQFINTDYTHNTPI